MRAAAAGLAVLAIGVGGCDRHAPADAGDPTTYPIQGIDVSRHQGDIDWRAVADAGIRFAWIKATEGGDYVDPAFRRNWELSRAAGLRRGAYHFIYWCRPAEDQAAWFAANVPADPDALPPVLDVEWTPQSRTCPQKVERGKALAAIKIMLEAMQKTYGRTPVIYTARDVYHEVLEGELPGYPMWLRSIGAPPASAYGDRQWIAWQYADDTVVPGIAGAVDRNCFVSVDAWRAWIATRP